MKKEKFNFVYRGKRIFCQSMIEENPNFNIIALQGLGNTSDDIIDLVIIGGFSGKGKRAGTYGSLLCAAYNHDEDAFETVTKLGAGFSDKQLEELPEKLDKYKQSKKPARVEATDDMEPDVWFSPEIVVEVIGSEITKSPVHTASSEDGNGLAIRFPRFKKYREDKKPSQATTSEAIRKMYENQKNIS